MPDKEALVQNLKRLSIFEENAFQTNRVYY